MKKRLASLVIGLSVALSLAIPVGAAEMKTPVTEFESSRKLNKVFRQRFPAQAKRRRVAGSIWGTLLMPK